MDIRSELIARVLEAILKLSSAESPITIDELLEETLISREQLEKILKILDLSPCELRLTEEARIRAILRGLEFGVEGKYLAKYLSWKSFEKLIAEILRKAGYSSEWNLTISSREGRIQIDILAYYGNLMLLIDCKHWNRPPPPSAELKILESQERRIIFLRKLIEKMRFEGDLQTIYLVPVVLSLYQPSKPILRGHIFSSISSFKAALEYIQDAYFQLRHEKIRIPRAMSISTLVKRLKGANAF